MDTLSYTPDAQNLPADPTGRRGLFIVVEGGDGAGKTTQLTLLNEALSARGYRVITTREPGGTEIGEKLRALVLEAGQGTIDDRAEALIFAASRADHASQLIRPALAEGAIVLSDRYIDSSAAYQGVGRDLGIETIVDLSRWATADLVPDATLLLSVPLSAEQERMDQRGTVDRIEAEGAAFKARIHGAFEQIAREDTNGSHRIIDGVGTIEQVHARVLKVIEPLLATREPGGTEIGEKLRALVLEAGQGTIDDRTEALIFAASRAAHASQLIRPALAEGAIVLSDRYIDSSAAYQGVGRDLGIETIVDLSRWATADLVPDATLLLSVPLSAEQERMDQRGTVDRIEAEGAAFKARIHGAFEQIAREDANGSHRIIDGVGTIEQVHARVLEVIEPLLAARELVRTGQEDS